MCLIATFIVPHPPLIVPEVGGGKERRIQKTIDAYEKIARDIAEMRPDTIVVTTPHSVMYSDYIHISPGKHANGDFREFGEAGVCFEAEYDSDFVQELCLVAEERGIPAGTHGEKNKSLDHGTMVPLYFINKYYRDYKLVRIAISGISFSEHYKLGECIGEISEKSDKKIIFIASGDLSHMLKDEGPYGYREEGAVFDREVTRAMKTANFLEFLKFDEEFCEAAAECGLRSFIIMSGALDGKSVKPQLLSYEGPFGVGYAVAEYHVVGGDSSRHFLEKYKRDEQIRLETLKKEEDEYVRLARQSLESYIINRKRIKRPENLNVELLKKRAGVFVSLKMDGKLRGCIGTISPTRNCIADEIIQNAISAGTEDPRFYAVSESELSQLIYSVDVLQEAEPIQSLHELDTKRYGVIVTNGSRRGLLLPNLDGIDTPEEQVKIALQKAGISSNENYSMERFEVARHK